MLIKVPICFFKTAAGNEPVREWLKSLTPSDRKLLGDDLQTIQLGWQSGLIGEPMVKSFGVGLFEMRSTLPIHRSARIFFCVYEQKIVLLHAFFKKTQKTPDDELELAKKRQRSLQNA